jgi:DegV family protein with EDD domain
MNDGGNMSAFVLSCCSTVDLPLEYLQKRNIPFAPFHFTMDGKVYTDDLGQSMPFEEFFRRIAAGALPTTSQINIEEFIAFYEPFLAQGKDILHISLSSGLSGTFNSAILAREELLQKYPGRKIALIDSLGASSGYGLLVDLAADLRDDGKSLEDLQAILEEKKLHIHHWFFSTDLTHYRRGGRISAASAVVGNLLNICPLMNMNFEGKLIPRDKIHGKKKVIHEIVEKMKEHAVNGLDYSGKCFISESACMDDARAVADLVEATFPHLSAKVMINSIGTAIGSHTGPGTVALFFEGDKRVD